MNITNEIKEEDLKSRYLSFWLSMNTQQPQITVHLPQGTIVQGTFKATDAENNRFRIDKLETPMGVYEHSVLRGSDIDVLEFNLE
ncbi:uncharacterized protein BX664DRAFT_325262 [Halteromyces radiatus]|uniref:uncharacterized protein n=1 Tax=Halteromyces radiatus TaxID=101107 RepID=UPI002220A3EB|nr:uncharacterized protein BX664DRAFT_325262 [Halteromyces radiatus]KAI8096955.1 hypothetical protein BX664DRAFT_325262 [Halteromyces radiatus]